MLATGRQQQPTEIGHRSVHTPSSTRAWQQAPPHQRHLPGNTLRRVAWPWRVGALSARCNARGCGYQRRARLGREASPSKVAVAIHRAAPSEQCWARARDRAFQNALRRHEARGIQGCRAARNRGRIGQVRTTGKPHRAPCRDEGLIAVIAVAAKGSSVAGGILTTPPAAGRCGRSAEQKQQQTCR